MTNFKLEQDKLCETMDELFRTTDFEKAYTAVLEQCGYNSKRYIPIFKKRLEGKRLSDGDKQLMRELFQNKVFTEKSEEFYEKISGFTYDDFNDFRELFDIDSILKTLKDNTTKLVSGNLIVEIEEIMGDYLVLYWNDKYAVVKNSKVVEVNQNMFVYDQVFSIQTINENKYVFGEIDNKRGYVKLGEEDKVKEKCIFDKILDIKKIHGETYIKGEIDNKRGYVKLGEEDKAKEKCVFDWIVGLVLFNGHHYIEGQVDGKRGYVKLGEEDKAKEKGIFDVLKYTGQVGYETYMWGKHGDKYGLVMLGKECDAWGDDVFVFDMIEEVKSVGQSLYIKGKIGNNRGWVRVGQDGKPIDPETTCVFKQVTGFQIINSRIYISGQLQLGKVGWIESGKEYDIHILHNFIDEMPFGEKGGISSLAEDERGIYFIVPASIKKVRRKKKVYLPNYRG